MKFIINAICSIAIIVLCVSDKISHPLVSDKDTLLWIVLISCTVQLMIGVVLPILSRLKGNSQPVQYAPNNLGGSTEDIS